MLSCLAIILVTTGTFSRSLWQDRNIYSAGESIKEGDILLVHINDVSQLKFNLTVNSDSSFSFTSNPDGTVTQFLPRASGNKQSVNKGKTSVTGAAKMYISIPATVTKKLKNNQFEIAGVKEYALHGVVNRFQVAGIVDPSLLRGRGIDSMDIAAFRFSLRGYKEGAGIEIKRGALKDKETAGVTLTEDEKQKIIVDYLNKVINELTQ
jgi:flagellar basal body L-ring protein FlgH